MPVTCKPETFSQYEFGVPSFWSLNLTNLLFSLLTLPNPQVQTGWQSLKTMGTIRVREPPSKPSKAGFLEGPSLFLGSSSTPSHAPGASHWLLSRHQILGLPC